MIEVDISADPVWGDDTALQDLAQKAMRTAITCSPFAAWLDSAITISISLRFATNAEVQQLNSQFREKDKPTNVLSFPMVQADLLSSVANTDDGELLLGDIILAHETCVAEAAEKNISLADHITHLMIHGCYHLIGHDHQDDHEAAMMEDLERRALALLGIANPY